MARKFIGWNLLPERVIERELRKYNEGANRPFMPSWSTWPSNRYSGYKKIDPKDLTKFIIKFKRRERWEMLKSELGQEYLERVHERSMKTPEVPVTLDR